MTLEEIKAARDKHMELRHEMVFNREVWSRALVRKFGNDMKRTFPHYFDCMTASAITFKFRNKEVKAAIVGRIKLATQVWHNEWSTKSTIKTNERVKIKNIVPYTKLFKG